MTESASPAIPPHRKVHVDLGPRAYDVFIGRGLLGATGQLIRSKPRGLNGPPALVVDSGVPMKFSWEIEKSLQIPVENTRQMPGGERTKSLDSTALFNEYTLRLTELMTDLKTALDSNRPKKEMTDTLAKHAEAIFQLTHRGDYLNEYF